MTDFLKHTKKSGFEIPKNYLDSLEDSIDQKLAKKHLPKKSGFKLPQDYFENFNSVIKENLVSNKKGKVVTLFSAHYLAYAAAIAAILILALNLNGETTPVEEGLSSVSDSMLEEYLQDIVTDMSEDDLLLNLDSEDINGVDFVDVSEETMLNYLDEQLEDTLPLYQ